MGSITTFYSYKGGVGRTMALANIAVLLAKEGLRVLIVDWDLEAPGLHRYFQLEDELGRDGLIDLLEHCARSSEVKQRWRTSVTPVMLDRKTKLDLIAAGASIGTTTDAFSTSAGQIFSASRAGQRSLNCCVLNGIEHTI